MPKNSLKSYSNSICILIILITLISQINCTCNICVQLAAFSCQICYNSCAINETLQFSSCTYTYCSDYTYDQNGTSSCIIYDTKQLLQSQCFNQCCQSNQTYFSIDQLNKCNQKSQKIIKIVIGVFVSFFGLIFLIFIICCIKNSGSCSCCSSCRICSNLLDCCECLCDCLGSCLRYILRCECCRNRNILESSFPAIGGNSIQLTRNYQLIWKQQCHNNETLSDEGSSCAICLNNCVNALTKCKHYYHIQCILQWYNRNPHCPLCKSQDAGIIKYFCRGCCIRFIEVDLKIHKNIQSLNNTIKGPNCKICQ